MFKIFWVSKNDEFQELDIDEQEYEDLEEELQEEVWQLAVDILETPYEFIILAPIAWIELNDIDLSFNNNVLTIRWIREKPEIYAKEVTVRNNECYWWKFVRNIILPENLDFDNINANIENNLLVVTIDKLQFEGRKIEIEQK